MAQFNAGFSNLLADVARVRCKSNPIFKLTFKFQADLYQAMDSQMRLLLKTVYEATEDGQPHAHIVFSSRLIGGRSGDSNGEDGWLEYFCLLGML